MTRTIVSTIVSELATSALSPILAARFEFGSGHLRLWSGYGDLVFDPLGGVDFQVWSGAGELGGVSPIMETQTVKSTSVDFTLSGIPSAWLSVALTESYQDRLCQLWLGFMDSSNVLINVVSLFKGRMDVMTIHEGELESTISVTAESVLVGLERANERRFTPEDQKINYPADTGYDQVASLQIKEIVWGR